MRGILDLPDNVAGMLGQLPPLDTLALLCRQALDSPKPDAVLRCGALQDGVTVWGSGQRPDKPSAAGRGFRVGKVMGPGPLAKPMDTSWDHSGSGGQRGDGRGPAPGSLGWNLSRGAAAGSGSRGQIVGVPGGYGGSSSRERGAQGAPMARAPPAAASIQAAAGNRGGPLMGAGAAAHAGGLHTSGRAFDLTGDLRQGK